MALRVVQPDETPEPKRAFVSISDAIESGSSRDVLATMRKDLARQLDQGALASNCIVPAMKHLGELDRLIRLADAEATAEAAAEEGKHGEGTRRRSFNAAAI